MEEISRWQYPELKCESGSHSLSDHIIFYAYGESEVTDDNFIAIVVVLGILVAAVAVFVAYRNKLFTN